MNELVLADKAAEWRRLKALVLDSVSSPITRRVYNLGLDEFFAWFSLEPRRAGTLITLRLGGADEAAAADVELEVALVRYDGAVPTAKVTTLLTNACCAMVNCVNGFAARPLLSWNTTV